MLKIKKLEPVYGSKYCRFSVLENKLAKIYRNQEKIYGLLTTILRHGFGIDFTVVEDDKEKSEEVDDTGF